MFQLTLTATVVSTLTGSVARVVDGTDWTQTLDGTPREDWAIFLAGSRLASVSSQEVDLPPFSYDPMLFTSGDNPDGTVDVPVGSDGIYRLRGVAVPVLTDVEQLQDTGTVGRVYYVSGDGAFLLKTGALTNTIISTWAQIVAANLTDYDSTGSGQYLLDKAGDAYVLHTATARAALARLNLAYLAAGPRTRPALREQYIEGDLLLTGAGHQSTAGFYADAATSLLACERLLGALLPAYAQSLPALLN